jgi:hypothetical protein
VPEVVAHAAAVHKSRSAGLMTPAIDENPCRSPDGRKSRWHLFRISAGRMQSADGSPPDLLPPCLWAH